MVFNYEKIPLQRLPLVVFVSLATAGLVYLSPDARASKLAGVSERLSHAEQCLLGTTHREMALESRLETLERQAVGQPQSGSALHRLQSLEKIIGNRSTSSPYLPPLATQLDTGAKKPLSAPDHSGSALDRGGAAEAPAKPAGTQTAGGSSAVSAVSAVSAESIGKDAIGKNATAAAADPQVAELLRKGIAAHRAGDAAGAEKLFKDVLVRSPFNPNAYYNLGAIAEQRGDLAAALGDYRTALIAHPDDQQLQAAVAQVEDDIVHKQGGPFQNPVAFQDGNHTVLRGSASDIGLKANTGYVNGYTGAPMSPYGQPYNGQINQQPYNGQINQAYQPPYQPVLDVNQQQPPGRSGSPLGPRVAGAGIELAGSLGGILRGGGNPASILGALHCPMCRLLQH